MLVGDNRVRPGDTVADTNHRLGQIGRFLEVETITRARRNKGCQMKIRVEPFGDVPNDRVEGRSIEPFTVCFCSDETLRGHGLGMRHLDDDPFARAEQSPCSFRQARLFPRQQVSPDDVQCRQQAFAIDRNANPRACRKAFRLADMAIGAHIDDVLLIGVDTEPAQRQSRRRCRPRVVPD